MGIETKKKDIIRRIEATEDEQLINDIKHLLDAPKQPIVAYTIDGKPLDKQAFIDSVLASTSSAKAGNFITQEDLEKEIDSW